MFRSGLGRYRRLLNSHFWENYAYLKNMIMTRIGENHNEKYVCTAGSMPSMKDLKFITHRFKWNKG